MSKVCRHCNLAVGDRSKRWYCLYCGRPLVHIEDETDVWEQPINKKRTAAICISLGLLVFFIMVSLGRNLTPCVDVGDGYYVRSISGEYVLRDGLYESRIRVKETENGMLFRIRQDGEDYSGSLIRNNVVFDQESYENNDPHLVEALHALKNIYTKNTYSRGGPGPTIIGGYLFFIGVMCIAFPEGTRAWLDRGKSKNHPKEYLRKLDGKGKRDYYVMGIIIMAAGAAVLTFLVSDKAPHFHYYWV